jgi:hypothetical protein
MGHSIKPPRHKTGKDLELKGCHRVEREFGYLLLVVAGLGIEPRPFLSETLALASGVISKSFM